MVNVRERVFSDKDIDGALNNPAIKKVKANLQDMAEALKQSEKRESGSDPGNEDEDMARPTARGPRPRGPLSSQGNERRVQAASENVQRIMKSLRPQPPSDEEIDSDVENEDEDQALYGDPEGEEERPPQTPAEQRNRRLITNRPDRHTRGNGSQKHTPAPDLEEVQALRLQLAEQNKKIDALAQGKRIHTEEPATGRLRFQRKPSQSLEGAQKLDLYSNFLFYDFSPDDFTVRPVDASAQLDISAAKQAKGGDGDESALMDALQPLVNPNIDIRLLTYGDYYFLIWWLRLNSYPNLTFDIGWTSKYGNRNNYIIEQIKFLYLRAEPDPEKLRKWREMGLDYPRMRDWEILNTYDLADEDRQVYSRAQYFAGSTPEEKADNFFKAPAYVLQEAQNMIEECRHGVQDVIDVVDEKFNPESWVRSLQSTIDTIHEDATRYKENDPLLYDAIRGKAADYEMQRDVILEKLKKKERVVPDGERISLSFRPLDIFPLL